MSKPAARTRLDLDRLDDRAVPSVVSTSAPTISTTTTARDFDFVGTGTLTTTDQTTSNGATLTTTTTNAVTLGGTVAYTGNNAGQTGAVGLNGTGTGNQTSSTPSQPGRGSFAQTVQGQLGFSDAGGTVASTTPLSATTSWITSGGSGSGTVGPTSFNGAFDPSTFQLTGGWGSNTSGSQGSLTVTLANKVDSPTTFTIGAQTAGLASDGSVTLNFGVTVTGNMLKAPSETTAATDVTAVWVGNGQTQTVSMDLPIYWNTGSIVANVSGLKPPAWATSLVVSVDAAHAVTGADETNASWTVDLSTLTQLPPPVSPPPVTPPVSPPPDVPPPPAPPPATATFSLVDGNGTKIVQFRDAGGNVIGAAPAFDFFSGPVSLQVADVNHDGVPDAILAAGQGGGPRVQVLDGASGGVLESFYAFDPSFRGGVSIAVASKASGEVDLVAGMGAGGSPTVAVFNLDTAAQVSQFLAYDPAFTGGVNVAAADLRGDGAIEVITGTGAGGGPLVNVFDAQTGDAIESHVVASIDNRNGIQVTATPTGNGRWFVVADPGTGVMKNFQNQLTAGGPLLEEIPAPVLVNPAAV